jgi:hypothetical protein
MMTVKMMMMMMMMMIENDLMDVKMKNLLFFGHFWQTFGKTKEKRTKIFFSRLPGKFREEE